MSPERSKTTRRLSRAFTLAEAVAAMGVMTVLVVGVGVALTASATAMDKGNDSASRTARAADAAERMLADLGEAKSVVSVGPDSIEFTVPDRDADGSDEVIGYTWDGAATGKIGCTLNGEPLGSLATGVGACRFDVMDRAGSAAGSEELLMSFEPDVTYRETLAQIGANSSAAIYVRPPLPSEAKAWAVTRVRLKLRQAGTTLGGQLKVSIVRNVNWTPVGEELASAQLGESSLPATLGWVELALPTTWIGVNEGVFIRVSDVGANTNEAMQSAYYTGTTGRPYNTFWVNQVSATVWSAPDDRYDSAFHLYGRVRR